MIIIYKKDLSLTIWFPIKIVISAMQHESIVTTNFILYGQSTIGLIKNPFNVSFGIVDVNRSKSSMHIY